MANALNDPKIRAPLTQDGVDVIASTPEGLARFQRAEIDKYARLVKELDLKTN